MKDRIIMDMKLAMKARDSVATETCRMLIAAIKNEEIAKRREITEEEAAVLLTRAVKTRQEAIALYEKGGRPELAEKERREVEIVKRYMPRQLTEEEISAALDEIIRELGVSTKKDLGVVMKALMARHPGRVDGRVASQIAASRLT